MRVAQSAASALRQQYALSDLGQVGDLIEVAGLRILLEDQRADRHGNLEVASAPPAAKRARAIAAALRFVIGIELKVHQRVAMRIRHRVHGAADAAVAAVGAAARDELLSAEAE